MEKHLTIQKILNTYGSSINRSTLIKAESLGQIPASTRATTGAIRRRIWRLADLPPIGEKYGFLRRLKQPIAISLFTAKGGVLKTTLTLNIARLAALHNIKTCVIGLDLQGDISNALGINNELENSETMEEVLTHPNIHGLLDFRQKICSLSEILRATDIPTLFYIPETPELAQLEQVICLQNRREYWLKENVVDPLKNEFDLIIMDCSPNWNRLITNALVASDFLISPLECKTTNFRNHNDFNHFLESFKDELRLSLKTFFIPTRLMTTGKLSTEIRSWYLANVRGCLNGAIRDSTSGEEAINRRVSLPEYAPTSIVADEMRQTIRELWLKIDESL